MSSKKEAKGQAAADKIKAVAMATKGLSRTQAERAANAAARNVNAYGQKEEGPSRWQERKELKRQMYAMSTEKSVTLGKRKDQINSLSLGEACQKCQQVGHWTFQCKNERVYVTRPSRTQILKNPKLALRTRGSTWSEDFPDEEKKRPVEEEKVKRKIKSKRKYRSDTESSSDSQTASESNSDSRSSSSDTGSDYSSDRSASSSSSSDSDYRRKKRNSSKKKQKASRKRYSSSSESSDSDSGSDSDSYSHRSRKKSKKHSSRKR